MSGKTDSEAWREWWAESVQPGIDALPDLARPCPCCGLTKGEEGETCGWCFICHGRNYCGCDGPEPCDECGTMKSPPDPCPICESSRTDPSQTASETLVGEGRDGDGSPGESKASPPVAPPSGTPRASRSSQEGT